VNYSQFATLSLAFVSFREEFFVPGTIVERPVISPWQCFCDHLDAPNTSLHRS
jgi:hypothetical protein